VSYLRGRADNSITKPTSRCRRTDSIVSLKRGDFSGADLQVFSSYRGRKEAYQAPRAILTTSRPELLTTFFLQGKARKEIHAILTETLGEHATSYATLYKRGDVSTCDAPRFVQAKTVTKTEIIDQIHEVVL